MVIRSVGWPIAWFGPRTLGYRSVPMPGMNSTNSFLWSPDRLVADKLLDPRALSCILRYDLGGASW